MYSKTILAAAAALMTMTANTPTDAQQLSRVVPYRDLDLASATGADALAHRLQRAIDWVCRRPDPAYPMTGSQDQGCRADVRARVLPQMESAIQLAQARAANQFAAR